METRRSFIIKGSCMTAVTLVCGPSCSDHPKSDVYKKIKTSNPRTAAVIWYSQAGNTARTGKLIAHTLRGKGLRVDASDYRDFDSKKITGYDLIVMGSPVFYYEVPENFRVWIQNQPQFTGTAVASYCTFGGAGGNQYNTAVSLLELQTEKGGVPVGMSMFSNMSTFAPTWSMGNEERILKYRHLPDETTFQAISKFASRVLDNVKQNRVTEVEKEFSFSEWFKGSVSIWGTKLFISDHKLNENKCIECGTCVQKCPTGSIDLPGKKVNTGSCIACMGCVNNCPVQAVDMTFMGKKVYGFNEFLKKNNISIKEPQ